MATQSKDQKICATCRNWKGNKRLVSGGLAVEWDYSERAGCYHNSQSQYGQTSAFNCPKWEQQFK